jgi:hypothetical protein
MADDGMIYIEGQAYSPDDLTFREQREMRQIYRDLMDDPAADLADASNMDFLPVLAFMIRRRDNPEYTLEQALDLKITELVVPPTKQAKRAAAK